MSCGVICSGKNAMPQIYINNLYMLINIYECPVYAQIVVSLKIDHLYISLPGKHIRNIKKHPLWGG